MTAYTSICMSCFTNTMFFITLIVLSRNTRLSPFPSSVLVSTWERRLEKYDSKITFPFWMSTELLAHYGTSRSAAHLSSAESDCNNENIGLYFRLYEFYR